MKKCTKCNIEKELDNFSKNKNYKDGLQNQCKVCTKEAKKIYYDKNSEKVKQKAREYHKANSGDIKVKQKEYREENKEQARMYFSNRRAVDPLFKLSGDCRNMLNKVFKRFGYKKSSKTKEVLGCSFEELTKHLEAKFEDWMNWDNKAGRTHATELNKSWDIDHVIPLSSATTLEEVIRLSHYTNLQPLCSFKNRYLKKNKI
tara:strand:- start:207 stop:812 length:606 start_codon:yes stop_codon:yes gene_type:complete